MAQVSWPRKSSSSEAPHEAATRRLSDSNSGWPRGLWAGILGTKEGHQRGLRIESDEQETVIQARRNTSCLNGARHSDSGKERVAGEAFVCLPRRRQHLSRYGKLHSYAMVEDETHRSDTFQEYVPGGDFRTLLNNVGVLHNRFARFYIAEMFTSVDALHQLGYIHRDLKPENFLVDSSGHIKLTDFGLAAGMLSPGKIESMRIKLEEVGNVVVPFGRPMEQRTVAERREGYRSLREREVNYAKSVVGSADYMAPEVLKGEEYDFTVDYWSLGCMLFEALAGYPPFAGASVEETWQNLKHWKKVFRKPEFEDPNYFLSRRTWNLIERYVVRLVFFFLQDKDYRS